MERFQAVKPATEDQSRKAAKSIGFSKTKLGQFGLFSQAKICRLFVGSQKSRPLENKKKSP
jgi:hypothetical protein